MRIERGGWPLAAQSNTQPGVIGFAFLFDIAVPGAPRRGFALMDQGPCADWKETQRRALSKTVQRRQFSQMRARSPALHRLERKFIWMTEPDRARRLFRASGRIAIEDKAVVRGRLQQACYLDGRLGADGIAFGLRERSGPSGREFERKEARRRRLPARAANARGQVGQCFEFRGAQRGAKRAIRQFGACPRDTARAFGASVERRAGAFRSSVRIAGEQER